MVTEVKNTLEETNSIITEEENRISELEDRIMEISAVEHSEDKRTKRNKESLKDFWDKIKCITIQIIPVPKEDKQKGSEKIFEEIIIKNLTNMGKEIVTQVQEVQRVHTG